MLYFCGRALAHIRRNPFVAGVTVLTVAVVFLVLGVLAIAGHNLARLAARLETGLQVVVFLEDDAAEDALGGIRTRLSGSPWVGRVTHVSRGQALERFRERLGAEATVLEGLGDNPLPASFEIELSPQGRSPQNVRELAQELISLAGVEEVQYGQGWLDRYHDFMGAARLIGIFIGALIAFATLVVVSNTIRLSVYARQDEIEILKLMGATDRFVRAPFYLEGLSLATLGAAAGLGLTWMLFFLVASDRIIPMGPGLHDMSIEFLPPLVGAGMVLGGAAVGLLGTATSLGRHLKG